MVSLANENRVSPDIFATLPTDLAFNLAALRPGEVQTPYLDSNGNVTHVNTGTARGAYSLTYSTSSQASFPYILLTLDSSVSNLYTTPAYSGLSQNSYLSETSTVDLSSFGIGLVARSSVFGTLSNFSDKFFIYANMMKLVVRTPLVNLSGTAWVGRFSYAQLKAGFTIADLKKHALEIDLKVNPSIELRSFINFRELHTYNDGTNTELNDEYFSFCLFNPDPVVAVTSQTTGPLNLDLSFKCSYLWWPDYSSPALEGALQSLSAPVRTKTPNQVKLSEELDRLLGAPQPPSSDAFSALIAYALNLPRMGRRLGKVNPRAMRRGTVATQGMMRTAVAAKNENGPENGWSDFVSWGQSVYQTVRDDVYPTFVDWVKSTALTVGKTMAISAVTALLADPKEVSIVPRIYEDDADFVNWFYRKILKIDTREYTQGMQEAYLELLTAMEDLLDLYDASDNRRKLMIEALTTFQRLPDRRGVMRWVNKEGVEVDIRKELERLVPEREPSFKMIPAQQEPADSKSIGRRSTR